MVGGGSGAFIGGVHRMAARLDDAWDLVAGALSSDPATARASAADLGIEEARCYADYREMARAEAARADGIDAVSIVTPNHLHFEMATAFLEAGIHVICDKPMTTTVEDAQALVRTVEETGLRFVLTHNNTGYAMVRQMREMVADGVLGKVRIVQATYAQDFLTDLIEATGLKQATWRVDPARAGAAATLGDIGVHAFNLAAFVTGLELAEVSADVHTFVEGRALDDNAHLMLRYAGGARGMLWASQTAPGNNNRLAIEVYGETGSVRWCGEAPDEIVFGRHGKPPQRIVRGGAGAGEASGLATRMPPGHPEGYIEGFGILYRDAAKAVAAAKAGEAPPPECALLPSVHDGLKGVSFIRAALASSAENGRWTAMG
jgi:predicted dehydrogenase